jgi:rod shape-determining protein MreC
MGAVGPRAQTGSILRGPRPRTGDCESILKRQHYIALGLVVIFTLILLNLPGQTAARIKLAIGSLFLPLFGLANTSHRLAEKAGEAVVPRGELISQNEALRRENERQRLHQFQDDEIARENARLRQLLGWQQRSPWRLKLANVVLRDPANWWRTVQIDLGAKDGVRTNLAVLTPEGLVGRVASVGLTRSEVVLVGDPNCRVAALVENDQRNEGVIESAGPLDSSLLTLDYLSKDAALKPGQAVLTSGLGGVFPRGIPIGHIVDFRPAEYGLYTEARVKMSANLGALEEVWVLFP